MSEVDKDGFEKLGCFKVIVEKKDSKFVPYQILHKKTFDESTLYSDIVGDRPLQVVAEELDLLETDQIQLPEEVAKLEPGTVFELEGELWGHYFSSYNYDLGREYDAEFDIREEILTIYTEAEAMKLFGALKEWEEYERKQQEGLE